MCDGFVLVPDQARQRREEVVIADDDFMVDGADAVGRLPRVLELAVLAIGKRNGERLDRPIHLARHDGGHRAAVDAAREKHPERDVRHQPQPHRLFEQMPELLDQRGVRRPLERRIGTVERQIPVLLDSNPIVLEDEPMTGQQLVDALEERVGAGCVARGQHFGKHGVVGFGRDQAALENRLDL
jgi:hypothetical protein